MYVASESTLPSPEGRKKSETTDNTRLSRRSQTTYSWEHNTERRTDITWNLVSYVVPWGPLRMHQFPVKTTPRFPGRFPYIKIGLIT